MWGLKGEKEFLRGRILSSLSVMENINYNVLYSCIA